MLFHLLFANALIIFSCSGVESFNVKIINGSLNEIFTQEFTLDKDIEYLIKFDSIKSTSPLRVLAYSNDAQISSPIMIVVKQKKDVVSWQLPMIVVGNEGSKEFRDTAKTLCYGMTMDNTSVSNAITDTSHYNSNFILEDSLIIAISTSSVSNVSVKLTVMPESMFYITPNVLYNETVTPSIPRVHYYNFPENVTNSKTVILVVNSPDNICMTISIQYADCPIYDLNQNIKFEGYFETITTNGAITMTKRNFPNGFFIVFVPKPDDSDCTLVLSSSNTERIKQITFMIIPSISRNNYAFAIIMIAFSILVFLFIFSTCFYICSSHGYVHRTVANIQDGDLHHLVDAEAEAAPNNGPTNDNENGELFLSDLAQKDISILKKQSYLYLQHVLTVAIFYGLPVIQLVINFQKLLNDTRDQDICYYNFRCAHPIGFFSDVNHILSNIGYLVLGLLYIGIIYKRQQWHTDQEFDQHYGIPQHYGLFYALGVALSMEGVLSGSYHICPNRSNFQFDTSFMYVIAVLCMIKLYQSRHPDINATAYTTFGVLAIAIVLGMWGIMDGGLVFWIVFTIIHILTGIYLTAQIYFMGSRKLDQWLFWDVIKYVFYDFWRSVRRLSRPQYMERFWLLLIGNVCNLGLAIYGFEKRHNSDFASHLLAILITNTILYFAFYIVMKYFYKERINCLAILFSLISLGFIVSGLYCYSKKSNSWSTSPAESQTYNKDCLFLSFYDYHDLWHFLSALGIFFVYMVLLLIDDDLSHTPRTRIHVF